MHIQKLFAKSVPVISILFRFLLFPWILCAIACSSSDNGNDPVTRSQLVSTEFVRAISQEDVKQLAEDITGEPWSFFEAAGFEAKYAMNAYKIVYRTIDSNLQPVVASGLLIIPVRHDAMPLLNMNHGTMLEKSDAPSVSFSLEVAMGILQCTDCGFLVSMPDYLGLGSESGGLHPYCQADSLASAILDMIRATRNYAGQHGVTLNDQLFVAGYSEGGYAAMAALRAMEQLPDEFSVTACAPMAGPYDMSGVMLPSLLAPVQYPTQFYVPYVAISYNLYYDLYEQSSDFLLSPYDQTLPPLFDGYHSGEEVNEAMPASGIPSDIFPEEIKESALHDPDNPFYQAMVYNDVYRWTPQSPVYMFHCGKDVIVPIANAQNAFAYFQDSGAPDVQMEDVDPTLGHVEGYFPCYFEASLWFKTFLP